MTSKKILIIVFGVAVLSYTGLHQLHAQSTIYGGSKKDVYTNATTDSPETNDLYLHAVKSVKETETQEQSTFMMDEPKPLNEDKESTVEQKSTNWKTRVMQFIGTKANADILPLEIIDIRSITTKSTATVSWNINDLVLGRVYYSTTSPVDQTVTPWVSASNYAGYANSKANIKGLAPGTTYYFKIVAKDYYGNTIASPETTFITK